MGSDPSHEAGFQQQTMNPVSREGSDRSDPIFLRLRPHFSRQVYTFAGEHEATDFLATLALLTTLQLGVCLCVVPGSSRGSPGSGHAFFDWAHLRHAFASIVNADGADPMVRFPVRGFDVRQS